MRLILALAAHYKPKSVKHSNQNSRPGSKSPSVTGIAQVCYLDGNLKSIMRLILALAAHYKPKSVKHSNQNSKPGSKSPSVTGIAQVLEKKLWSGTFFGEFFSPLSLIKEEQVVSYWRKNGHFILISCLWGTFQGTVWLRN